MRSEIIQRITISVSLVFIVFMSNSNAEYFVEVNPKSVPHILKSAEDGDPTLQVTIGMWYQGGMNGLTKNMEKAAYWYTKAANQGQIVAQRNLANLYYSGMGVTKDLRKSIFWLEKAAHGGDVPAQTNLGLAYIQGDGVPKDFNEGYKWTAKAAEKHDAVAQRNLGFLYLEGKGVQKNMQSGVYWLQMAAKQGDPVAIDALKER